MVVVNDPLGDDERAWRLLVLEDAGELMAASARAEVGQGLSRLLNLTDGLLGQGVPLHPARHDERADRPPAPGGPPAGPLLGVDRLRRRSSADEANGLAGAERRRPHGPRARDARRALRDRRGPRARRGPRRGLRLRPRAHPLSARATASSGTAPARAIDQRAVALPGAQVDDGRRRARQLAAVEDEVGGARGCARARRRAARVRRRPRRSRSTAAPASAPRRAARARRATRARAGRASPGRARRRAGSGGAGWAAAASRRRAAAPRARARVRGPSSGSAASASSRSKNITAAGLSGRRRLRTYSCVTASRLSGSQARP